MGAFTHVSRDRDSRFSDGSCGVWYCGDRFEVALAETAYHFQRFMRRTSEPPGDADYRVLTCAVTAEVEDASDDCLEPGVWAAGQHFGRDARARGVDGIYYRSVRYLDGCAAAIFWPNCLTLPITQNEHLRYRWDGARMTHYLPHGATASPARRNSLDDLADCWHRVGPGCGWEPITFNADLRSSCVGGSQGSYVSRERTVRLRPERFTLATQRDGDSVSP